MAAETLTLTRAAALARPLGFTIRREPEAGEIVAYAKGTGKNAAHAYFTDCPVDALATVAAMADGAADPEALKTARDACHLADVEPEAPRVVDMTPTWASLAPALFLALTKGTPEGQDIARAELTRALSALDDMNAAAKAAPVPEAQRREIAARLARADVGHLRAFAFAVLAHGQDAAGSAEDNLPGFDVPSAA